MGIRAASIQPGRRIYPENPAVLEGCGAPAVTWVRAQRNTGAEMTNYAEKAALLRAESDRNHATAAYLMAVAQVQAESAKYIDRQYSRGDTDMCEAMLSGLIKLIAHPEDVMFAATGVGTAGKVGY